MVNDAGKTGRMVQPPKVDVPGMQTVYEFSHFCGEADAMCVTCELAAETSWSAQLRLAELVKEKMLTSQLRFFLQGGGGMMARSDEALFREATQKIATRQLHLLEKQIPVKQRRTGSNTLEKAASASCSVQAESPNRLRFDAQEAMSDVGEVSPQVATLLQAAQNGTPFCEICEKNKQS